VRWPERVSECAPRFDDRSPFDGRLGEIKAIVSTGRPRQTVFSAGAAGARRLAELGVAAVVEGDPPDPAAITTALARPPGGHALDLNGVAATRMALEQP